jgi:hypothetical protein
MQLKHSKAASRFIVSMGVGATVLLAAFVSSAHEAPVGAADQCSIHCNSDTDLAKEITAYMSDRPVREALSGPGNVDHGGTDLAAVHAGVKGYACGVACGDADTDANLAHEIVAYLRTAEGSTAAGKPLLIVGY